MSGKHFAVLTGDLVKSTRLSGDEMLRARAAILDAAKAVGGWRKGLVPARSEFFRDDSWQVLLADPGEALRVALFLRARLLATRLTDTRIAIGIGPVSQIEPRRVSLSRGEAFVRSGEALDGLKQPGRMALATVDGLCETDWAAVVIRLCDVLMSACTSGQASVLAESLVPGVERLADIARRKGSGATARGMGKALRRAGGSALEAAVVRFESADWQPAARRKSATARPEGPRDAGTTAATGRTRR